MVTISSSWLEYDGSFGLPFDGPWGVAMLPDGALCVIERGPPRIQVVADPSTAREDAVSCHALPLPHGEVDDIQGVCCDGTTLLVADIGNNCVHRLKLPSGEALEAIDGAATVMEGLSFPRAAAVIEFSVDDTVIGPRRPERMIAVCDSGNGRVQIYDAPTLTHVRSIGKQAASPADDPARLFIAGELEQPLGCCVHGMELFVVDGYQHRISVFCALSGRFVRALGEPSMGGSARRGELASPFGALVVRNLLVVSEATRLQLFSLDGVCVHALEVPNASNLSGVCASDEHIFVADATRGCVHRLRIAWTVEDAAACVSAPD
jgi:hypothetical protein